MFKELLNLKSKCCFIVTCALVLLLSSCMEDKREFPFNPSGDVFVELSTNYADSSTQYRICAFAFDYNYGQPISPSLMMMPSNRTVALTYNNPFSNYPFFGDTTYNTYNEDATHAISGIYTFELSSKYGSEDARVTDLINNLPPPSVNRIHIDSISTAKYIVNDGFSNALHISWNEVHEANYYVIEFRDSVGALLENYTYNTYDEYGNNSSQTEATVFFPDEYATAGSRYNAKVYSVTSETGTRLKLTYKTCDARFYSWR